MMCFLTDTYPNYTVVQLLLKKLMQSPMTMSTTSLVVVTGTMNVLNSRLYICVRCSGHFYKNRIAETFSS